MLMPEDYYAQGKWDTRNKDLYQREKIALQLITPLLKEHQNILDIGCGDGTFLSQIKHKNINLHGVDFSEFQLQKAQKIAQTKQCDLEQGIPHKDNSFDIIYCAEVIEHVHNPDFLLEECNRILKQDGYIILSTPNLCAWFNRILVPLGIQPLLVETSTKSKLIGAGPLKRFKDSKTPVGHVRIFNKDAITDLLEENGFKIQKIKGAIFDSGLPKAALIIDNMCKHIPGLAADFVILAKKTQPGS